jgi:hypothetical protein
MPCQLVTVLDRDPKSIDEVQQFRLGIWVSSNWRWENAIVKKQASLLVGKVSRCAERHIDLRSCLTHSVERAVAEVTSMLAIDFRSVG